MADVSKKLAYALDLIETGQYFIISRPRQYGKTTLLYTLADTLRNTGDYIVMNMSFEGIGDAVFNNEQVFSTGFVKLLAKYASAYFPEMVDWLKETANSINSLEELEPMLTTFVNKTEKKIVLMIDEVDKSSNNQLFISFLAMLRNKYLERHSFKTFHSVVLAGLHDVKSLKLKLRPDDEKKYNSPWNIAAEFTVDMNLNPTEIKPMLEDYARDKNTTMDTEGVAERLFYYTSGYPFLVSKMCKIIDETILPERTDKNWTLEDVETASVLIMQNTNTNFDSLIKNLENNPELYELVYKKLVSNEVEMYSIHDPIVNWGLMHGILKNGRGLSVHNRIYEAIIYDYMTSKTKSKLLMAEYNVNSKFKLADNRLNMELVLRNFQAFMREQHSLKNASFLQLNGRLVFLAFIKPIINGSGYDFKEVQISEERRLDVTITYFQHKYVAELKVWRGPIAHEEGLAQLLDYLDRLALDEGYLLIFDNSKKKTWKSGWQTVEGKKIFMVWV